MCDCCDCDRIDELEDRLEEQQERIDELEEVKEENAELKKENAELRDRVDDLEMRADAASNHRDAIEDRIADVDDQLDEKVDEDRHDRMYEKVQAKLDAKVSADTYDAIEGVPEPELTWMERFYHKGREAVDGTIRKRDLHAKVLLEGLPDWAWKTNNGDIVLPTKSRLKAKLKRALGADSFEYSQLHRAMEALAERAGSKIGYVPDHKKLGKHLRIAQDRIEDLAINLEGVTGPPSSNDGDASRTLLAAV